VRIATSSVSRPSEHGFTPLCRSAEHGFTLVELLVSLFIFGMLSAAGVSLLSFSVRAQEAAGARLDEMAGARRMGAMLAGDLAQAAPRSYRDAAGTRHRAFTGSPGQGGEALLAFVRRGWENLDGSRRPSLQKIVYRLVDGRLERLAYPLVDGSQPLAPAAIVDGVRGIRLRYRDAKGEWRDRWDPTDLAEMPVAVELVVEAERPGAVRQLFLTGSGA